MPLSTSSKIRVGTVVAFEVMTEMASEMRASSPPEATLASGRGGDAGVAGHQEFDLLEAMRAGSQGFRPTSKRPPLMLSSCIASTPARPGI
jgi:hypothetical protein